MILKSNSSDSSNNSWIKTDDPDKKVTRFMFGDYYYYLIFFCKKKKRLTKFLPLLLVSTEITVVFFHPLQLSQVLDGENLNSKNREKRGGGGK